MKIKYKENQILHGNCIKEMVNMPKNYFDLIFADPPYNLQLKNILKRPDQSKVNGVKENWKTTGEEKTKKYPTILKQIQQQPI